MTMNERKFIEKTLKDYEEKEYTKFDELKALDAKAKKGPRVFSYVLGTIGSLILGFGMSVAMGVILKDFIVLGILVGIVGLAIVCLNYPLHMKILAKSKAKYAKEIKRLSNELLEK